jgi:hypothetical protein
MARDFLGPREFDVSVRQRRTYDVEHLEDAERAFAVNTTPVFELTVENPVHSVQLEEQNFDIELLNPFIDVEAVVTNFVLSEYDEALLTMNAYYGNASTALGVFTNLDQLVRVNLYKGTNGIIT